MVDRDTGFIDCLLMCCPNPEAVPMNMTCWQLVGNATNQGIYGMAQISDRTYDQLNYPSGLSSPGNIECC